MWEGGRRLVNVVFDQPGLLWLSLLVVPIVGLGWRALTALDRLRRSVVLGLRAAVLLTLVVMLAGPRSVREHHDVTVIGVLDLSGSVRRFATLPEIPDLERRSNAEFLRRWFRTATQTKAPDDRFGLIVFDGKATVISVPVRGKYVDDNLDVKILPGTNIAEAIRMALALFPAHTARRIVLVSDGNETAGDAREAAREAAAGRGEHAGVPIDVVPIRYSATGDVQVLRVEAPPTAQAAQTVTVRIVLAATEPARGRLVLRLEGEPVDLNGARPGTARHLEVPAGKSVHLAQVVLGESPINRFEAIFEPDDPAADILIDNNRAEAFTATPSRGRVLVLDRRAAERPNVLARTLEEAGIPTRAEPPHLLGDDLLALQRYDLIVLDNVAAYDLDPQHHELLSRYVRDLGGGLIMIGGDQSFGPGGWAGTVLEPVFPLRLDPPKELRLASAALVLVLDKSGSMNQHVAGTRTTQQRIANEAAAMAIESLRRESLIGVVTFDFFAQVRVPLSPNEDPRKIADEVRSIAPDGGTNLAPALRAAHRMLRDVEVQKKLVVCLSDGQSATTNLDDIATAMAADDITLTTIAVGDDADYETLERLADLGGGEFYPVRNPRTLPRVLVDSVQVINKPLIKEEPFVPVVRPTGSTLTAGMESAPILDGLVITAPRPDPRATVEMTDPDGEPPLAHWQVGLGRVAAFTSDADGHWSSRWLEWPGYSAFWTQLVRTITRPATSPDTELVTYIRDDRLYVALEATGQGEGLLDYLHVDGVVYAPDGTPQPLRLPQMAPGRYETSVPATAPGNYIVALGPRRGTRRLAPVIGGASQSASPEFRSYRSNLPLLEEIARTTGGRLIDITRPESADLFDRDEMPVSRSALPVWQSILWVALALVLLDVASRRLAWDAALLRRLARRAVVPVERWPQRGREAAATLATLRQVSERRDEPRPQATRAAARTQEPPEPLRPAPSTLPPDPTKVSAAIRTLLGKGPPPAEHAEPPEPEPPPAEPGSTETTSGLLAAKRRARRRLEEERG